MSRLTASVKILTVFFLVLTSICSNFATPVRLENKSCNKDSGTIGDHQSPIDIETNKVQRLKAITTLRWNYQVERDAVLSNTGHGWQVSLSDEKSVIFGGPLGKNTYVLEQFHCHWGEYNEKGSEHSIDGKKYSGELHLVHWNSKYITSQEAMKHKDGLSVVAIFLTIGKENAELAKVVSQLPSIQYKGQSTKLNTPINLNGLMVHKHTKYYTYYGSLTTPPYSEIVTWIVMKDPITVSQEQLAAFRKLKSVESDDGSNENTEVTSNYRHTFPMGSRDVYIATSY